MPFCGSFGGLEPPGRLLHDPGERSFLIGLPACSLCGWRSRQQPVAMACGSTQANRLTFSSARPRWLAMKLVVLAGARPCRRDSERGWPLANEMPLPKRNGAVGVEQAEEEGARL